jgi:hypothetical protein
MISSAMKIPSDEKAGTAKTRRDIFAQLWNRAGKKFSMKIAATVGARSALRSVYETYV